jgi:hypothetical protein
MVILLAALLVFWHGAGRADTYDITSTNLVDTWVTNLIEVRIPRNHFVNQYRTNWVERFGTNTIGRYATNWHSVTLTNFIPVEVVSTNQVKAYLTNWAKVTLTNKIAVDAYRTNFVDGYRTNWKTFLLTKDVVVDVLRTNFVDQYRTNWKTLTFTNWETVLVMRTNWVNQPVTNLVQIDLAASGAAAPAPKPAPIEPMNNKVETSAAPRGATWTEAVMFEATRTGRQAKNGQVEVQLKARWKNGDESLQVQQWRIQGVDGAILCLGQEQQFRRELPVGKYRVEVKLQRDSSAPLLVARGELEVMAGEALIHEQLAGTATR